MPGKRTNPLPTPVDTNLSLSSQEKGPLSFWMVSPPLMMSLLIHIPLDLSLFSLQRACCLCLRIKQMLSCLCKCKIPNYIDLGLVTSDRNNFKVILNASNSHLSMNSISKGGWCHSYCNISLNSLPLLANYSILRGLLQTSPVTITKFCPWMIFPPLPILWGYHTASS